jgi:hypothetical protein
MAPKLLRLWFFFRWQRRCLLSLSDQSDEVRAQWDRWGGGRTEEEHGPRWVLAQVADGKRKLVFLFLFLILNEFYSN